MAKTPVKGRDVALYLEKEVNNTPTYVRVGCVGDVGLTLDAEVDEATCSDSGKWKEFILGQNSWSGSSNLTARTITGVDIDTNVSVKELVKIYMDQTPLLMRFSLDDTTKDRYEGTILLTKVDLKGQLKGPATAAISFQGSGELALVVLP